MQTNIGRTERIVRVIAGVGILSLAFVGPASPWGYLGIAPVVTGLIGWCPPYTLLGIDTSRRREGRHGDSRARHRVGPSPGSPAATSRRA